MIEPGEFAGCRYGDRSIPPFTGPRDCPVCFGSGVRPVETVIPHQCFGREDCCGRLLGEIRESWAEITCNECLAVVRRVPVADLRNELARMELSLDLGMTVCPHCRSVNLFPGMSRVSAYVCQSCGWGVGTMNTEPGEGNSAS